MGGLETSDVILAILYVTGAILLFITSYMLFIKRFKKGQLQAINDVILNTSRYDVYKSKTQFMIELTEKAHVQLSLLNEEEKELDVLLDGELEGGENVVDFDPTNLDDGIYYLSLKSESASLLRKITIAKN